MPADDPADQLFELDPGEFVAARNALAKRLRAEGRKADAATVAGLRRPTVPAWALNQVARREPELIAAALDAGTRLREAMDAAVGGDAGGLRDATAADRHAAGAVAEAAAAVAGRADVRPAVEATLRAAVLDDDVAEELAAGVLAADHDAAGFGFGAAFGGGRDDAPAPRPAPRPATRPAKRPPGAVEERKAAKAAAAKAEEAAKEERRRRRAWEAEVARLEQRVARLSTTADRLETEAREARDQAAAAEAELEELQARGPTAD